MEELYKQYKDIAEFYIVYIREAHASDSGWPVPYAKEENILQHKTFKDRCAVAEKLLSEKKLTIPCLIDDMDNTANEAYGAFPDRVFLVQTDGRVAVAGDRGPWGFAPGVEDVEAWLKKFTETGKEPPPIKKKSKRDRRRRGDGRGPDAPPTSSDD